MPILLDTSAISEYRKPRPNPGFVAWSAANAADEIYLGAPTLGELIQGIHALAPSPKRLRLQAWVAEIEKRFASRIAPFDVEAARVWGMANGKARRHGRVLPFVDSQLAAIAVVNGLTVVTRNVRDFEMPEFDGLNVVNPWT